MQVHPIYAYRVIGNEKIEERAIEVSELLTKYHKYEHNPAESEKEMLVFRLDLVRLGYKNIKIITSDHSAEGTKDVLHGVSRLEDLLHVAYEYCVEGGHILSSEYEKEEIIKEVNQELIRVSRGFLGYQVRHSPFISKYLKESGPITIPEDLLKEESIREIREKLSFLINHFENQKDIIVDLRWLE